LKKHSKFCRRSEASSKRAKSRGPVQRDAKEVMAEVLGKLTGKLNAPSVCRSAQENRRGNTVRPNLDRLTVGAVKGQDERPLFGGALDSSPRHHRRVMQMERD
jgi:hypothetical protein